MYGGLKSEGQGCGRERGRRKEEEEEGGREGKRLECAKRGRGSVHSPLRAVARAHIHWGRLCMYSTCSRDRRRLSSIQPTDFSHWLAFFEDKFYDLRLADNFPEIGTMCAFTRPPFLFPNPRQRLRVAGSLGNTAQWYSTEFSSSHPTATLRTRTEAIVDIDRSTRSVDPAGLGSPLQSDRSSHLSEAS